MPRSRLHVSVAGGEQKKADFPLVAIGASAGGLDACRKFLRALPDGTGMAFVLVQHLDPNHESLMVTLLAECTSLAVQQASDGMPIQREHLYVIPPGTYLSVAGGILHVSPPPTRHGARLPFDFLLRSLAGDCGAWAACVVLSGTGADGSLGLRAVKEGHGLVIVQDPEEADFDGMPRGAIMTGLVDLVLPAAQIPAALAEHAGRPAAHRQRFSPVSAGPEGDQAPDCSVDAVIDLLRGRTNHDFTLYKPGTLQRRIERRMGMAGIGAGGIARYLNMLRNDPAELDLLATDLLIKVTSFFRDPEVFALLAQQIVPELVRGRSAAQPVRIWVAGCSTGEETYSLVMLFSEVISAAKLDVKLQVFASDVDPDAVATAREGLYPESIAAEVSPARLSRFFSRVDHGYRVSKELRSAVVFAVQDVLADPPFSRLDLVSCRNLLIYLRPEAQARVLSLFHFALCDGGILLLGSSETVGEMQDRFAVISKPARLYRHIGRALPGEVGFAAPGADRLKVSGRTGQSRPPPRDAVLAELCQKLVVEAYAPAAVLINRQHELLYALGPIDRYLRVAPGPRTSDLFAMTRPGLSTRIRAAIHQASQRNARVVMPGGRDGADADGVRFSIAVQPVASDGEALLLICFVDELAPVVQPAAASAAADGGRIVELEQELAATRAELEGAIRNLEISTEEQRVAQEEALSVSEEFQSTNEELVTSKEEMHSLNEELTALNTEIQETLERQRTTANDLQNILNSTNVATLFLDRDFNIRFFTPATRSLFRVIPTDIGRPIGDVTSLTVDAALLADAPLVVQGAPPIEREVETTAGTWFVRRILPYRTQTDAIEGVVVTFTDISEQRRTGDALRAAKQQADLANEAKSRFLAAASHDLRQPLQTLALIHGLQAQSIEGDPSRRLLARSDETLDAMSSLLNTLLDINQLEVGAVHPQMTSFPVDDLLERLQDEFSYHAQARGLEFRVVACGLRIASDPRLLAQMIRNLVANALKYTPRGKVLLGCRRHGDMLSIEIWDTGIGIPEAELQAVFKEYHQIDNAARERSRGLGLGLSIVQRLGHLLGHQVRVRSVPGKGSTFAVDVKLLPDVAAIGPGRTPHEDDAREPDAARCTGMILVIEDDPEMRDLLELLLKTEGHRVASAADAGAALELVQGGTAVPDVILADYNLPNGMDGLRLATTLRQELHRQVPVVILTGDISAATLHEVAGTDCVQLYKPVKVPELTHAIQLLLASAPGAGHAAVAAAVDAAGPPVVFVVDDDGNTRASLRNVLEVEGMTVKDYASGEAFLAAYTPGHAGCLLVDAYLAGMSGLQLLRRMHDDGHRLPAIMVTGNSDVHMAVEAMKAGALDFLEKPVGRGDLLASVDHALEVAHDEGKLIAWREAAAAQVAGLTSRQRQIMDRVLAGQPSKNIAADLGISQRTVENHRAEIMKRTGARSLPALARLALAAAGPQRKPIAPAGWTDGWTR